MLSPSVDCSDSIWYVDSGVFGCGSNIRVGSFAFNRPLAPHPDACPYAVVVPDVALNWAGPL